MTAKDNIQTASVQGMARRARPEILAMTGYASARSLVAEGGETIFLDANECAFEPFIGAQGLARYPMQQPAPLRLATLPREPPPRLERSHPAAANLQS